jgi:dUTP pyrophosphatase
VKPKGYFEQIHEQTGDGPAEMKGEETRIVLGRDPDIKIKILDARAITPKRATNGSVGVDLHVCSTSRLYLVPGLMHKISTGVSIELPPGYEAQVRGRSGLSSRGVIVPTGTIDWDYRGEICVLVACLFTGIELKPGDRIAQLIVSPVWSGKLVCATELSDSERGDGGFGSTGT